jgi:hypothetical protein
MKLLLLSGVALIIGACATDVTPDDDPGLEIAATASALGAASNHIHKSQSPFCLVAQSGPGERPVLQTRCAGFSDQNWNFRTQDGVHWQIHNIDRNQCLVTRGINTESKAVTSGCNFGFNDQLWLVTFDSSTGLFAFHNENSEECLAARSTPQAIQTTCGNFSDQKWILE